VEEAEEKDTKDLTAVAPAEPLRELEWRQAYSGPDRATDVRDLTPATQYQLRVCAINAAGASPYSGIVSVETPACVPSPVAALTAVNATATSICFKFKKAACNGERIEEYNVEWTDKVSGGL
jgi:predicted phage tail protein